MKGNIESACTFYTLYEFSCLAKHSNLGFAEWNNGHSSPNLQFPVRPVMVSFWSTTSTVGKELLY
jgi:hypothetical protein